MVLSDLSIRRPVLATVMSLLLVVLGVIAYTRLTLRELPAIDPPVVSVSVDYPGASAAVVETRITQVLEDALSGIEGVETIESDSSNGEGSISIEFSIDRDIEAAANDVRDAVSRVVDRMPDEADPPDIEKAESDSDVILWLNMSSTRMDTLELTDYADRYVVDRLSSLDGVSRVRIAGGQRYAMRIWLDSAALAARGLTVANVEDALERENVELPAGSLESTDRDFTLRVQRSYREPADFAKLTLAKGEDGYLVRLGDVARVERASEERRAYFRSNGVENLGLGIVKTSTANSLDVARAARATADEIQKSLPEGMRIFVAFDSTLFIEAAVERVFETLFEAIALVIVVIYLFLGNARSALIPAVTIPVCLVTAFAALWAFGFTINLLTLLAIVLCIGLVVDDAIVVVENIQRRADLGEPPLVAARRGTAQVAFAVIATTVVLVAVFLPVGFMEGNTGRLFRELSVALASAVAISCFVALSLTPMMSSKLIRAHREPRGLNAWIHGRLTRLADGYRRQVAATIGRPVIFGAILAGSAVASLVLFNVVPKELAPGEDRGAFFITVEGPEGAGYDYTVAQVNKVERLLVPLTGPDKPVQRVNTRVPGFFGASEDMNSGQAIIFLQDWDKRDETTAEIVASLRSELAAIPSVRATPFVRTGLIRSNSRPLQIVLGGPDYKEIAGWRDSMLARMADNPGILDVDSDYKETRPQLRVEINFERAADLGVSTEEIGTTLETMMGSRRVTTFVEDGEEYDVVLQARVDDRAAPANLENLYVRSERSGRARAAVLPRVPLRDRGAGNAQPLQSPARNHDFCEPGRGIHARRGDPVDAGDGRRRAAGGGADRLQGAVARIHDRGRRGAVHVRDGAAHRLPGTRRAVRKLHPSVRHHADGSARGNGGAARPLGLRQDAEPLQPDRHRDAGRPRGQERHPDRGLREQAARRRPHCPRGDRRGSGSASPADPHDVDCDDRRRRAARRFRRPRLGEPLGDWRRGDLRRGVLDLAVALRRSLLLCAARAPYRLPGGALEGNRTPRSRDAAGCRRHLKDRCRVAGCQAEAGYHKALKDM